MAGEKLLTEAACKAAKPKKSLYYISDGGGLRLRIRPDGSRSWLFRFHQNGKENTCSFGPYPDTSLQQARLNASDAKQLVRSGISPSTAKKVSKAKEIIKGQTTFGVVAKDWLEHNKNGWSKHHIERNEGLLRRFLLPEIGNLPIDSISEALLFTILKKVYDSGIKESARRTRAIAAQIFAFGRATHRGTTNPAKDMSDNPYFKKPPVNHFKALGKDQVGDLVQRLNESGKSQNLDPKTICAIKMDLYTGLRDNSIRGARWKEVDFEDALWTVPAERMKNKKVHQVPLPRQALKALSSLKPLTYRSEESFIFSNNGKYGFMSENTIRQGLHKLGFPVTAHGMRSLITDVLNEKGFNRDAIERQLDHVEPSSTRRAYLRSDFMEERVKMMQWFANWCDTKAKES
ncbi:MAG: integrase arm-type DNA-binding domain-containing protein [Polynucleobacter sp.]|nr:integrase arm-type DNA-binding domain-containing protein [Polynucleobacter sp.]